jgi:hypothetical protein
MWQLALRSSKIVLEEVGNNLLRSFSSIWGRRKREFPLLEQESGRCFLQRIEEESSIFEEEKDWLLHWRKKEEDSPRGKRNTSQ